nr:MAG TPA: hypothetical protein [Caudoviricetes sp.]
MIVIGSCSTCFFISIETSKPRILNFTVSPPSIEE